MTTTLPAGEFKAKCLAILDEVAATGREVVVTKRGTPVARVVPLADSPRPTLVGSVRYAREADLVDPVEELWDADQ